MKRFPPACVSVLERPRLNPSVSEPAEFMSQRKQRNIEILCENRGPGVLYCQRFLKDRTVCCGGTVGGMHGSSGSDSLKKTESGSEEQVELRSFRMT